MAEKRRLPVLQPKPENPEDDSEPRPPWHWIGFGVVGIFGAWLPLAALAQAIGLRLARAKLGSSDDLDTIHARVVELPRGDRAAVWLALLAPQVMALALASLAGGFLIGRWGKRAGVREAAIAGAAVSALAGMLSCSSGGAAWGALAMGLISTSFAALGARFGARRVPPAA
jgi:tRNA-(ms[2]io[6]A)-hydroxylase